MARINALESLRGLMALWVVIGHTIRNAGFSEGSAPRLLLQPGLAVDVFIILSGFVIFFLLDRRASDYQTFLTQRFFRLAPIYLAMLAVSCLMLNWETSFIANFPFQTSHIANNLAIHLNAQQYLPAHLLAHLFLLHGLISSSLLPGSDYAFLGAAWSISVEWQFYLVAPLLYWLVAKQRWRQLTLVVIGLCAVRATHYGGEGFAINQAGYFLIGIVSYYGWKHCNAIAIDARLVELLALLVVVFVYLFTTRYESIAIWMLAFSCIVAERRNELTAAQSFTSKVLNLPVLQWLGQISYSVYLTHMFVFYVLSSTVLKLSPKIGKAELLMLLLPAVPLVTIALSTLTHRFIEQPGIALGKRWSQKKGSPALDAALIETQGRPVDTSGRP